MNPLNVEAGSLRNPVRVWASQKDAFHIFLIVVPPAFVLGMLTSLGQAVLPNWLSSVANSAGGWSVVVFGLIWAARCKPVLGSVLGVAAFFLLIAGYAAASSISGNYYSVGLDNIFVILSFIAGPLLGLAAASMRSRSAWSVAAASAVLPAILIGEGVYGLAALADTTSPVYWTLSIAVGASFLLGAALGKLRSALPILLSSTLTLMGAAITAGIYTAI